MRFPLCYNYYNMKLFKKSESQDEQSVGTVLKCPHCGEILSSLDGKCPACGHEINTHNINSFIKQFSEELNEYENDRKTQRDKKVIKDIIVKEKTFIETYPIDNNVASVIELLLFINNRIVLLENDKRERKLWQNVWLSKAKEAKAKGDLLSPNDEVINREYNRVVTLYEKLYQADKKRRIITLIVWLSILGVLLIVGIIEYFFGIIK